MCQSHRIISKNFYVNFSLNSIVNNLHKAIYFSNKSHCYSARYQTTSNLFIIFIKLPLTAFVEQVLPLLYLLNKIRLKQSFFNSENEFWYFTFLLIFLFENFTSQCIFIKRHWEAWNGIINKIEYFFDGFESKIEQIH